ncbi:MAG: transposase [Halobacteriovoraceae bacterium]|nr:transposase [Halobacteriovoraceae bacterium]MCB9095266.1 transposase [Halobacteriovoraceae bacterium]
MVFKFLSSGVSQRRLALNLGVHRLTIKRKLLFWAKLANSEQKKLLQNLNQSVSFVQIDDLITIEHTKLKPLSVSLAIKADDRTILGAVVSQIPAFGHLAELSRKKYGRRKSTQKEGLNKLMEAIAPAVHPLTYFESDEHQLYPPLILKHFPGSSHQSYPSERGAVTGQGELKKIKFDPLFSINHTCAMLRANINRLFRRTWCTTKLPEMLQKHLDVYVHFHNTQLI